MFLNFPMFVGGLINCYHQMMTQMCEREKFLCNQLSPSGGVLQCVVSSRVVNQIPRNCEAQARVRQGSARDGPQGERPQSLNPCLELTLKLVATTTHHPPTHPPESLITLN